MKPLPVSKRTDSPPIFAKLRGRHPQVPNLANVNTARDSQPASRIWSSLAHRAAACAQFNHVVQADRSRRARRKVRDPYVQPYLLHHRMLLRFILHCI